MVELGGAAVCVSLGLVSGGFSWWRGWVLSMHLNIVIRLRVPFIGDISMMTSLTWVFCLKKPLAGLANGGEVVAISGKGQVSNKYWQLRVIVGNIYVGIYELNSTC